MDTAATTITTAQAAAKAGVTVDTIRTWCRRNVIAARKVAGRWMVDASSLAYRVSLGNRAKKERKVSFTVENMVAIGGSRWTKYGHDRVYLDNWAELIGLEIGRYKSGNIHWACLGGEKISNSEAYRILGQVSKVYFDAADRKVHIQWGFGSAGGFPRSFHDREELAQAIFNGIRAAIAAL